MTQLDTNYNSEQNYKSDVPDEPDKYALLRAHSVNAMYLFIGVLCCYVGHQDSLKTLSDPSVSFLFKLVNPIVVGSLMIVSAIIRSLLLKSRKQPVELLEESYAPTDSLKNPETAEEFAAQAHTKSVYEPKIRNMQDFVAGILYIFIGLAAIVIGKINEYELGSLKAPAEGFFPFYVGLILCIVGVIVVVQSLRATAIITTIDTPDIVRISTVLLSVYVFAHLLQNIGLQLTVITVVMLSATASHEFKFKWAIVNALIIALLAHVIFILILGLNNIPSVPSWIIYYADQIYKTIMQYLPSFW